MSPGSLLASPGEPLLSSGDQQRTGTVNTRHPLRNHNGTRRSADFLTIFLSPRLASLRVLPSASYTWPYFAYLATL